jgi:hypothetical protein
MSAPKITIMSLPDELLSEIAKIYVNDELGSMQWPQLHYTCKRFNKLADPINIPCKIRLKCLDNYSTCIQDDDFYRKVPDGYKQKIIQVISYAVDLPIYSEFDCIFIHRKMMSLTDHPEILWSACKATHISFCDYWHPIKFEYITNMRTLTLSRTAHDSHYDLRPLIHLKELFLCQIDNSTFDVPSTLTYVRLDYCIGINGDEFINVDKLTMACCRNIEYNKFDNNIELYIASRVPNYRWPDFKRIVNLRLSPGIGEITYIPYIRTLKKITLLDSSITDISSIAHLEYINVKNSKLLHNLPYMPNVETLCITGCPAIYIYTTEDLLKLCPKLKDIIS